MCKIKRSIKLKGSSLGKKRTRTLTTKKRRANRYKGSKSFTKGGGEKPRKVEISPDLGVENPFQ